MRILLMHQNFPGQFRHVAQAWSRRPGWQVVAVGRDTAPGMPGIPLVRYKLHRAPGKNQHHYLRQMEAAVLHGQAVLKVLMDLKRRGFTPDAILAHPGWGESLYVRDVFSDARLVHFCEWYYGTPDSDLGFDPEFPATFDDRVRVRTWNALHTLNLEQCDAGISPTQWQRSRHPEVFRSKIQVMHEGIDTETMCPDSAATFKTPSGVVLRAGDPVITYVARNLEPYRGFHSFMRALEIVQRKHGACHALIVGGDDVSYGRPPKDASTWRETILREVNVDASRTHFLGRIAYDAYRTVLQVSAGHVYLTYPFVLSWSMLEAMACGCLLIGSKTAPVEEVIDDDRNGWLVDFFSRESIAAKVLAALEEPSEHRKVRLAAGRSARTRFGLSRAVRRYEQALLGASGLECGRALQSEQCGEGESNAATDEVH